MIRKLIYSKFFTELMRRFFSLFYDKRYLTGKFFDEKRMGFVWCLRSLPRVATLRRQGIYFPVGRNTLVGGDKIDLDPSSLNVMQQPGCYFQAYGHMKIGKDVWIAPNVGIVTTNHDPSNPELHLPPSEIIIGDGCWIGMNSVILPGVELGEGTTVGAGSVVTKSFKQGHCVLVGSPARMLRKTSNSRSH